MQPTIVGDQPFAILAAHGEHHGEGLASLSVSDKLAE